MGSRWIFGGTVFLGAFLLFLLEPMAAKALVPVLGGSSAVWVTCLVFFQAMLLLGYLYAHWLARGRYMAVHLALLGLGVLALAAVPAGSWGDAAHPVATIFRTLGLTIGLPFLLLASTSPLLQVWRARLDGGGLPYGLFALSNLGSLLGLVAYPTLIEPHVSLRAQRLGWALGFAVYAGLAAWLAAGHRVWMQDASERHAGPQTRTAASVRAMWFLLPMGAAVQLAAVTAHLTVNIAAIPLLWMLPLAAYLISFIVAFEASRLYARAVVVRLLVVMMAGLGYALTRTDSGLPIAVSIPFFLVELYAACLFCHAEVYRLRPADRAEATGFYLHVAAGGAAGTFLVAIVSPLVFSANYDLAISFFVIAALALAVTWRDGWTQRLLWSVGSVLLLALTVMLHVAYSRRVLEVRRNFYGPLRVTENPSPAGPIRMLTNGTIQHGTQFLRQPALEGTPTTYYGTESGVGLALGGCCAGRGRRVGVIGLGVGTLAAYGQPGDRFRFYEINPLVRPVTGRWFTYLADTKADVSYAEGDGRASLTREPPQGFDVLVIDAFSGDAIPLHLLTVEAMRQYRRHLAPDGVLAVHVSNQYLNLAPEIGALARAVGMEARVFESPADVVFGAYRATWVLIAADPAYFASKPGERIAPVAGVRAWTDDYSSLLPLVQWGQP